jgi:TRAP-type C4-dicarboxylate transport system permease small subunit
MSTVKHLLTFRWANATSQLTGYLSAAALIGATAATMHGVASRYFLGRPTIWQTELSIYLLMFVTFVGGAYGLRHHAHVGVDLFVQSLRGKAQLAMRVVAALLALVVVLVVLWTSYEMWHEAYMGGWTTSTAWGPPLSVVYAILPLGMLFVACQYVAFIIEGVLGLLGKVPADEVALLKQGNPELHAAETLELEDDPATTTGSSAGPESGRTV